MRKRDMEESPSTPHRKYIEEELILPLSPKSFIELDDLPKRRKRRRKGLPKYVKHKELWERDVSQLTPRQALMIFRKKGEENEILTAIDKEREEEKKVQIQPKRAKQKKIVTFKRQLSSICGESLLPLKKQDLLIGASEKEKREEKEKIKIVPEHPVDAQMETLAEEAIEKKEDVLIIEKETQTAHEQINESVICELTSLLQEAEKMRQMHLCPLKTPLLSFCKRIRRIQKTPREYSYTTTKESFASLYVELRNISQNTSCCL
ncbi:hypothetical protein NEFER03_0500 [Nematocida sp. LUAm3]|nr:hypothetical protein NEFER03_0500 [Nematocida sp. LUAm3]KAI5175467.1 hypothetical protein NEFER02_1373 [Nematocida sp. LUAm2]KAI5178503.1 hypothetical protein NEFER01_1650 [Nematocida sp. LUAm1]